MKNTFYLIILLLFINSLKAANGDTTKIKSFDNFHMNRYGNFDTWVKFPDGAKKYQKIIMKYTLGCTSNGQCEWDYTNTLLARENTGKKDSTLKTANSFSIIGVGTTPDSLFYFSDTTYKYSYNKTTKTIDSIANKQLVVLLNNNAQKPTLVTDTLKVWPTYYTYNFDTSGNAIDSFLVKNNANYIAKIVRSYYQVFDVIINYELGRMITPYAKFFPKDFKYTYVFDVTDFASKLKDSIQIRMDYSGYSYGFTCTVDFEFIEGTPARDVIKIEPLYFGYFPYGNTNNSIENYLVPKTFNKDISAKAVKLRLTVSGHGGENNEGCSEFCPKKFYLKLNNTQIAEQLVWKDNCGENAITAQGGTWIYDRANWCPGEQIAPYEYELNTVDGNNNIDMDFESFVANGSAGYNVVGNLIYYNDYNYSNEATVEEIIYPSNDFRYQRLNPICENAQIILKNNGKKELKNCVIKYQSGSKAVSSFTWQGSLAFGKSQNVNLPYIEWDLTDKTFKVWVEKPNGQTDENTTNDKKETYNVVVPKTFPSQIIIETTTNKFPLENSWTLKNAAGNIVKQKSFTTPSLRHVDTLNIGYGCFTFQLDDKGKDGLDFWASRSSTGTGSIRITATNPYRIIQQINADFGSFYKISFTGIAGLGNEEIIENSALKVFPNPATNQLNIQIENSTSNAAKTYQVYDLQGKLVYLKSTTDCLLDLDVTSFSKGMYLLIINMNNQTLKSKFVVE
ncbi:MAG: peptide-N-glycosidase F-related protein [Bacteroidia bacterium]